jgi:hypothetical protein
MKVRARFSNGGNYPDGYFRIETPGVKGLEVSYDLTTVVGEVVHTFGHPDDLQALVVYQREIRVADGRIVYHLTLPWWALKPAKAK